MRWYLRLFSEFRRMEKALQVAHESDRKLLAEVIRLGDVAYRRRHVLTQIAACETPGANATVRRMARMAREVLDTTSTDVKTDDVYRVIPAGGRGVGLVNATEGDHPVLVAAGGGGGGKVSPGEVRK